MDGVFGKGHVMQHFNGGSSLSLSGDSQVL